MNFSSNVISLIEKSKLSDEERHMLENPPEIARSTIDHLISFSNKPINEKNKQPKKQNSWLIFLKNYGEYLRKSFPNDKFPLNVIVNKASSEWNNLKDTDYTKRYFKILEKVAEENRKYLFENGTYLIQKNRKENKWKAYDPYRRNNSQRVRQSPNSTQEIERMTVEDANKIAEDLQINTTSGFLSYIESLHK